MRVLGLLISSSLSSGRISCDNSSRRRRLQICGQFLCTTERKAWSRTMLAAQPISASWSLQNNFYVYAMFEKQWLLVPENSLQCSCSQLALQSLPWALIIWSQPNSLDADRGKIWSTETEAHAALRSFALSPPLPLLLNSHEKMCSLSCTISLLLWFQFHGTGSMKVPSPSTPAAPYTHSHQQLARSVHIPFKKSHVQQNNSKHLESY